MKYYWDGVSLGDDVAEVCLGYSEQLKSSHLRLPFLDTCEISRVFSGSWDVCNICYNREIYNDKVFPMYARGCVYDDHWSSRNGDHSLEIRKQMAFHLCEFGCEF